MIGHEGEQRDGSWFGVNPFTPVMDLNRGSAKGYLMQIYIFADIHHVSTKYGCCDTFCGTFGLYANSNLHIHEQINQ